MSLPLNIWWNYLICAATSRDIFQNAVCPKQMNTNIASVISHPFIFFNSIRYYLIFLTWWNTAYTSIFPVATLNRSPTSVSTSRYGGLISNTFDVIHPYNACSLSISRRVRCCQGPFIFQLPTNYTSIQYVPKVVTNRPPDSMVKYFDATFV